MGLIFRQGIKMNINGIDDYKRSCHSACLRVPLVIEGPGYRGGKRVKELVSTASLPKTFLAMAGIEEKEEMIGEDLKKVADGDVKGRVNEIFAQISESRVGRCVRTEKYLYSVYAPQKDGRMYADSDIYEDDFLYDLEKDPYELHNLIYDSGYEEVKKQMAEKLIYHMKLAKEKVPVIKHKNGR